MESVVSAIGRTIRRWPLQSALIALLLAVAGQALYAHALRGDAETALRERSTLAADLTAMKSRLAATDAALERERAAKQALAAEKRKADEAKHVAEAARRAAEAKLASVPSQLPVGTQTPAVIPVPSPVDTSKPASVAQQPAALAAARTSTAAKPAAAPQALRVTATQLSTDYQSNEVAADGKYQGKNLEVTGKVKAIDSGLFGEATVILEGTDLFYDVRCNITDDQRERAARLTKGAQIVVHGTGASEIMGSPIIDGCLLP